MTQLTIEIPEALAQRLTRLTSEQKRSVGRVAIELKPLLDPAA